MQTDREILLKILAGQVLILDELYKVEKRMTGAATPGSYLHGAVQKIKQNQERIIQEFTATDPPNG